MNGRPTRLFSLQTRRCWRPCSSAIKAIRPVFPPAGAPGLKRCPHVAVEPPAVSAMRRPSGGGATTYQRVSLSRRAPRQSRSAQALSPPRCARARPGALRADGRRRRTRIRYRLAGGAAACHADGHSRHFATHLLRQSGCGVHVHLGQCAQALAAEPARRVSCYAAV